MYRLQQLADGKETSDVFEKYVEITEVSGIPEKKAGGKEARGKKGAQAVGLLTGTVIEDQREKGKYHKVDQETGRTWQDLEDEIVL